MYVAASGVMYVCLCDSGTLFAHMQITFILECSRAEDVRIMLRSTFSRGTVYFQGACSRVPFQDAGIMLRSTFSRVPYTSKYLFKTGVSPCHRCHSCARSGTNLYRRSSVLCIMLRGTFSRGTLYLGAHLPFQEVALFEHSLVPAVSHI